MTDLSSVTRGLALCCASRFADIAAASSFWSAQKVFFRAGPLMPPDLFTSPSLREAVSYVTITPLSGGYEGLSTPLGQEWVETLRIPPVLSVEIRGRTAQCRLTSRRAAPGIIALIWTPPGGEPRVARHVVDAQETEGQVAQSLASQFEGAVADENRLSVSAGSLRAVTGGYGRSSCLIRRQSQIFRLSLWTSACEMRPVLGDLLVSRLLPQDWLALTDGRQAQIFFEGEDDQDAMQTQSLFRRDVRVRVIFDRYDSVWSPQMVAGGGWMHPNGLSFPFDTAPDQLRAEIPVEALDALAAAQEMPSVYRSWDTDCDGTVRLMPRSV
ncbi:hypothetical protein HW509_12935 [Asaia spathodeae]|uniref:hypothetical protein n=1 Tax=Asaia spathodeae TaxID=657016 RepID=UPI002FC39440